MPTIFRRIRSGEYRVPPFQRDFVWEEKQILELLESVYRGFPIGSILLWRVDKSVFKSVKESAIGFPSTDERYPASFVLDGVQRLSSLYGIFNRDEVHNDKRFDVYFDLEAEVFLNGRDKGKVNHTIPLSTIFHPRAFLDQQRNLASLPNSDFLLERAISLLAVFQEYMVPVVSIAERSPTEVVNIFQRINSTGVRLGVVDFMRALTWSDEFDLTTELDRLRSTFEERGFTFDDEMLLKALGIILNLRPLPDVLLHLRGVSSRELHRAVRQLEKNLTRVSRFVASELGLANADALPYEAQWLLLIRLVHEDVDLLSHRVELVEWITASSFFEALKGRPDHALVRMIDEMALQFRNKIKIQFPLADMRIDEFMTKRFLRGKATSVAYVQLLIRRGLFDAPPILEIPYEHFGPIVSREILSRVFLRDLNSAKTIGNVVFLPHQKLTDENLYERLRRNDVGMPDDMAALEAQFIDIAFIKKLRKGDVERALTWRAAEIFRAISREPET
jgi:Protein of unknown function DUF262